MGHGLPFERRVPKRAAEKVGHDPPRFADVRLPYAACHRGRDREHEQRALKSGAATDLLTGGLLLLAVHGRATRKPLDKRSTAKRKPYNLCLGQSGSYLVPDSEGGGEAWHQFYSHGGGVI